MSLPFKTTPMLKEYFNYQVNSEKKYGKNTIVFMEVGSFFEIYQIDDDKYKIGKSKELGEMLNIQVTRKSKSKPHCPKNPYMVGFPNYSVDKYISKLVDKNYTIVTVIQKETVNDGSKSRVIDKIYSPSTYTENNTSVNNYLLCIYMDKHKDKIFVNISAIDFSTGDSKLYSTFGDKSKENKVNNDIFKFIHSINPKEIIINIKDESISKDNFKNKYQLTDCLIHYIDILKEYKNINYQNQFLKKIFKSNCKPIEYLELTYYPDLVTSFIACLQFAYEHDNTIINKIKKPKIVFDNEHLILNNDSIYQLNIINKDKNNKYSSLLNLVDYTSTNMGKRLLKNRILYPITNCKELEKRYKNVSKMKNFYKDYIKILSNIIDIEKYNRKVFLKKLEPFQFCTLHSSYLSVSKLLDITGKFIKVDKTKKLFNTFYGECSSMFDFDKMKEVKLSSITHSFFKKGIFTEIDELDEKIVEYNKQLQNIAQKYSKCNSNSKNNYVSVKVVKKDCYYLSCSPSRINTIKQKYPEIRFQKLKSYVRITSDEISKLSNELCQLEISISDIIKQKYINCIYKLFSKNKNLLHRITDIIAEIDVMCSSAKVAIKYCYNRPTINNKLSNKSYVNVEKIRHPIIERIIDKEYIVNDVNLNSNGMLLYGVNSSGKSSIIRSIGCNLVLAQAGMFVACEKFEYFPYTLLLSKISCKDNLFVGHSTFISEMIEIRNMIQRSDNNTMILADELCSGTESLSAVSIVSSTISHLIKQKSTFLISTHLHGLMELDYLKNSQNLSIKHFGITVDKNTNILYNRKLMNGSGDSLYGLEIAKSLNIGSEFMKNAFDTRSIIEKKNNLLLNTQKSKYNSKLYIDHCNICKKQYKEVGAGNLHTHHINFQKNADSCGIIKGKHFHKNSLHNLIVLCKECHQNLHKNLSFKI